MKMAFEDCWVIMGKYWAVNINIVAGVERNSKTLPLCVKFDTEDYSDHQNSLPLNVAEAAHRRVMHLHAFAMSYYLCD